MTDSILYSIPSALVALGLLVLILGAVWLGRLIEGSPDKADEDTRAQSNAVQGALVGLLALLLGFTFSLSLARHDDRSGQVVAEANAIGTAWLRLDLLPETVQPEARTALRAYTEARVAASRVAASDQAGRDTLIAEAEAQFDALWMLVTEAARSAPGPATVSVVTSLNDMIDALAARDAAVERHVPELVLILMFGTFIILGGIMGYTSAQANTQPGPPAYAMIGLIVILVFIIIDLDRPRRGLISVDQTPLVETLEKFGSASG